MRIGHILFLVMALTLPVQGLYAEKTPPLPAPQDTEFIPVLDSLLKEGLDAARLERLFSHPDMRFNPNIPALFFTVQDSQLDYGQFSRPEPVQRAKKYMIEHETTLKRAEKESGVPPEILTALLLVETRLGTFMGRNAAIANLASIAAMADPDVQEKIRKHVGDKSRYPDKEAFRRRAENRAAWARKELAPLLRYAEAKGVHPAEIKGSYAGAVGICQFMPSNIEAYAADGDGDGIIRLSTHEDAIFSAARYLKEHGWKRGMNIQEQERILLTYNRSRPYARAILDVADKLRE
ncbi:membrane-bound lytic murein transglycosylase B [Desulfobotulus alkaliphilus]|uniref:Membrane-bound lytic murein transglycosylase B n=1 Tax=Desulfobotulus alkaliphilus TaxID=622671 RepID=A0A562S3L1_9BACT|nr:lytic murein transglycosylase [Desulfobotulus alkaliphilus]TWI75394.1 membrane-bound lytic murein transglycosylase B [Desulfobotulus alkaliphilus]